MDVGCPKCQTEYELDDARVSEDGVTVKCTTCGHVFRVKKKSLVVTVPVREPPPAAAVSELPPPPPSREWKVRQASGNVYGCRDLTMLQKWIIEGKVLRDDEISLTGETWKRLGNIPELASFFQIVEDAAKARALEALQRAQPPPAPVPSAPRITDTWKGGQFTAPAPAPAPAEPPPQPEVETLPPDPPPPRRRETTQQQPQFQPATEPPVNQTMQGGRFSEPAPPLTQTLKGGRFSSVPQPEPSDEELRRAVGKGGGGAKWALLILLGLGVGGGVGWYFGVYEPEQKAAAERAERERLEAEAEARARAVVPPPPVMVVDASVEVEDAGVDAGPDAGVDAGAPDAGAPDAGPAVVDAGAPPVVVEQKRSFDWYVQQGDRYRDREKPELALDMYGKAHDLKPDRVEPLAGRGLALLDMANPSAAIASFEAALRESPRYGPAIMGMAEAYRAQGKNEKAIEYYQRYLDVLPNGAEAAVARNSIERLKK